MLTTTNYKFKKPELTDSPPDITVMNSNWDIIDTNLKKLNDDKAPKDVATTSKEGLMSKTDKSKLDGIAEGANAYMHPSKHPASIITEDATHRFLTDAERKLIQAWEKFKASGGEIGGRVSSEVFLTLLSNSQQYGMYNRGGHLAFPRYNSNGDFVDIPFEIQPNGDFYCNGYSKNPNGHTKLPNGMILQWGKKTLPMNNDHTAMSATNFPITFPTEALVVIAGNVDNSAWRYPDITCGAKITSKAAFTLWAGSTSANTGTININLSWIAIGY